MSNMQISPGQLLLALLPCLCLSCDRGTVPLSLQPNFVWSESDKSEFDRHVEAYYWNHENRIWAALLWKGRGQVGPSDDIVLLCVDTMGGQPKLEAGLALQTWFVGRSASEIGSEISTRAGL